MQSPPHYGQSDPATIHAIERQSVLLERQRAIGETTQETLHATQEILHTVKRIEKKLDHRPKNGNGRINLGFVVFKDMQSMLLCLAIIFLITGHITIAEIKNALLR